MKRLLSLGVLAFVVTALPACAGQDQIRVYARDTGREIRCQAGDRIPLSLEANPTTGYDWEISEVLDASVIQIGEREYVSSSKDKNLVGVGGICQWRMRALRPGTAHLELGYRRHWEKDVEPIEQFSLDVRVE